MKLYQSTPTPVIRLDMNGGRKNYKSITVVNTNPQLAIEEIKRLFQKKTINSSHLPTQLPGKIVVSAYEMTGTKKGKSKSCTLYGLTIQDLYDEIMKYLKEQR
jgi:hypothetical protein